MIPRTFKLINSNGETLDITSKTVFFHEPKGLGFTKTNSYYRIGSRYIMVDSYPEQIKISGKVALVGENPYESYFNFIKFCELTPLYLLYTPRPDAGEEYYSGRVYRLPVVLSAVEKTELELQGHLDVSVTFEALSPWFRYEVAANTSEDAEPLIWGIRWGIRFGAYGFKNGIVSDGASNSPSRLTIYGPIKNPKWKHFVNGNLFGEGRFNTEEVGDVEINENEMIMIDNTKDPFTIVKCSKAGDILEDLYPKSDFATKRFLFLQQGKNTIEIRDHVNGISNNARLEAYLYYDTV